MTRELPARGPTERAPTPQPSPATGPPPSTPGAEPTPVRFAQDTGTGWVEWTVVEEDASAVPGAPRPRCLIFTRTDCIRRVWDYPADWRALDAGGLAALSWRR